MIRLVFPSVLLTGALIAGCTDETTSSSPSSTLTSSSRAAAAESGGKDAFGFNGSVRGFPTGVVRLTGGGAYDPATATNTPDAETFVHSAGGFDCTAAVEQGPLAGCGAGEGVRWDTAQLLASTTFKCTGAAEEELKTAVTDEDTAVLVGDFYRAGDGIDESFTAQIIISATDIAPDIEGLQTLWIQGVGCGDANVHFNA
jgi:hypothetical protein